MSDKKLLFQFEISENDFGNILELRDDIGRIVKKINLETDNEILAHVESYYKLLDSLELKGKINHE